MMCVHFGRPSVLPEKLLRALLLQTLYTIQSEQQLISSWTTTCCSAGSSVWARDPVCSATTFTKNRDRLLDGNIAAAFFEAILILANRERSESNEHWCLRCLLLVMCTHPFAKKSLTLHLARSEGHERHFGCNLTHRKVLASSYQHLIAEAPARVVHAPIQAW